jgi:hypothetical protein
MSCWQWRIAGWVARGSVFAIVTSAAWGSGEQATARITFEYPVDEVSSPGVEAGLPRPQRDILTIRRYGFLPRNDNVTCTARMMPEDVPIQRGAASFWMRQQPRARENDACEIRTHAGRSMDFIGSLCWRSANFICTWGRVGVQSPTCPLHA